MAASVPTIVAAAAMLLSAAAATAAGGAAAARTALAMVAADAVPEPPIVAQLNTALTQSFVFTRNMDDEPGDASWSPAEGMLPGTVWSNQIFASSQAWPTSRRVATDPEIKTCCCLGLPFYDAKDHCNPMRYPVLSMAASSPVRLAKLLPNPPIYYAHDSNIDNRCHFVTDKQSPIDPATQAQWNSYYDCHGYDVLNHTGCVNVQNNLNGYAAAFQLRRNPRPSCCAA